MQQLLQQCEMVECKEKRIRLIRYIKIGRKRLLRKSVNMSQFFIEVSHNRNGNKVKHLFPSSQVVYINPILFMDSQNWHRTMIN